MRIKLSSWHGKALLLQMLATLMSGMWQAKGQVSFSAGIEIHSAGDFYSPMSQYGLWVDVGNHGRCWRPARVETGWCPYTSGHWEWTDCGWYWVSDEPWAWACYHYGSWVYDATYGWVWIPGTEWAPAWVVWREGPDYIGWAPCGPGGVVLPASFFVFVDATHFRDPIRRDRLIVNNTTIINRTRVINNITRETRTFDGTRERVVVNRGPGVDPIQRATGKTFAARPVREVATQTPVPQAVRQNRTTSQVRAEPSTQQTTPPVGRPQGRIYQETKPPQTTEKEQPRIYHEPEPVAPQAPPRPPERPSPQPEPRNAPEHVAPPPTERPALPPAREPPGAVERGRPKEQPPAQAEPPLARPAPNTPPQPQSPPPPQERGRGQEKKKEGESGQ